MKATILMICNVSLIFLTRDVFLRFVYQLNMYIFFLHFFFLVWYTMLFVCFFLCRKWKGSSKMNHCFLFFCLNLSFCQGVRLFFFFIFHSNTTIIINNNSRLYSYYVAVLSIFLILIMFIFHYSLFYF